MAADGKIGGAHFELSVRDMLSSEMKKAEQQTKSSADAIARDIRQSASEVDRASVTM